MKPFKEIAPAIITTFALTACGGQDKVNQEPAPTQVPSRTDCAQVQPDPQAVYTCPNSKIYINRRPDGRVEAGSSEPEEQVPSPNSFAPFDRPPFTIIRFTREPGCVAVAIVGNSQQDTIVFEQCATKPNINV